MVFYTEIVEWKSKAIFTWILVMHMLIRSYSHQRKASKYDGNNLVFEVRELSMLKFSPATGWPEQLLLY